MLKYKFEDSKKMFFFYLIEIESFLGVYNNL